MIEHASTDEDIVRLISNAANVKTENNSFSHEFGVERAVRRYIERSEISLDVTKMLGDFRMGDETMQEILIPTKVRCQVSDVDTHTLYGFVFVAVLESLVMVAAFGQEKYIARYSWGE